MRCLVVPVEGPILEYALERGRTLSGLQRLVGGFIDVCDPFERGDVTGYVNDEGKFTLDRNDRATILCAAALWADDYVAGPLVVAGFDPRRGETAPLPAEVTAEALEQAIASMHTRGIANPTLAEYARENPDALIIDALPDAKPLYPEGL